MNNSNPSKTSSIKKPKMYVVEYVDGKMVNESKNQISTQLYNYLLSCLDSNIDRAIDHLFSSSQVQPGAGQNGRDGITMYDDQAEVWITLTTTAVSPQHDGKRWRGEMETNQQRLRTSLALGHNYGSGNPPFDTVYATWSASGLTLPSGSTYAFEWELSFE